MFFTRPQDFKAKQLAPGINSKLVWGDRIMLNYNTAEAGAAIPTHKHPHEQMGMILGGIMIFTIENETVALKKGDAFLVPGNVEHSARFEVRTTILDVFSPPREDYK
jgi:quercetin dioxygenase-like cupin family protein